MNDKINFRGNCRQFADGPFGMAGLIHAALLTQELASDPAELFGVKLQLGACIAGCTAAFLLVDLVIHLALRVLAPKLSQEGRVRLRGALVSCVHDLFAVPAAFVLLASIVHPEPSAQGLFGVGPHSYVHFCWLNPVGSMFAGFLIWDLVHYCMYLKIYQSELASQFIHHTAFLTMLSLNRGTLPVSYAFPILYFGEISTFFLNIRLIYRNLGWGEKVFSALFAITFFVARILLIGALLWQIFTDRQTLFLTMSGVLQVRIL